jgi:thiosulfate dehydrogenase (quinone) large subunit
MYMKKTATVLRIVMAFIFLWAFFDKTFGLGFATPAERAWINGGSPTNGFLTNAVQGPFADFFGSLAGIAAVDWLFMLGLLGIGLSLLLNKWIRFGSIAGIVMMLLMYLAVLPPENHPLIDDHIVYALVLGLFAFKNKARPQ